MIVKWFCKEIMGALANIISFWAGNANLNTALPSTDVYTDMIPPSLINHYPYAVLSVVSSKTDHTTGTAAVEYFTFRISIYSQDLNGLENLTDTIAHEFDKARIGAGGMTCLRQNRITITEAQAAIVTYHNMLEYIYMFNRTI